jgi:ABC-2 type transport system ATP-binding protein
VSESVWTTGIYAHHFPRRQSRIALQVEDVRKAFTEGKRQVKALKGVSMQAREGFVTGLVGPDGAGKTTLMRLCAGLLRADSGVITVLDIDVEHQPLCVQGLIGYMPQQFGLYEDLTVQENLDLFADLQGVTPSERHQRYEELLRITNLSAFTKRLAGRLSGGMKHKLGVTCSLLRWPRLLILDEPTVGVDPLSRSELWKIFTHLVEEKNITILLSTAYLDEAERCDEIVLFHDGRVLESGPPGKFTQQQAGRTFMITTKTGKRELVNQLSRRRDVVDAVIQGDGVRTVMVKPSEPSDVETLLAEGVHVERIPPRFEDYYVGVLRGRHRSRDLEESESDMTGHPFRKASGESIIRVENAKRRFGSFYAVRGISFKVGRGEVFGLLGANGAGKTTTFRMLCGLLPVTAGIVSVAGVSLRKAAAKARNRIGYMSQKFSLYSHLSVIQNLTFFSSAYGLSGKHQRERVRWALSRFNLGSLSETASGQLPLGFKQRLALACALMHEPDILFLDEPTSGVDPIARREFWGYINRLSGKQVTVLITTHFMEEAEYCDRLAIMVTGRVLALGTPAEIKQQAAAQAHKGIGTIENAFIHLIQGTQEGRRTF